VAPARELRGPVVLPDVALPDRHQRVPRRDRSTAPARAAGGRSALAELLDASVAAVNSALQRAREALKHHLPERRQEWARGAEASAEDRALVQRYIDAHEQGDGDAVLSLLHEDARFSMPPAPGLFVGRAAIRASWEEGGFGSDALGELRCVLTAANMQPAVACYVRRPSDTDYRAMALDVLRVEDGAVAEIITFEPRLFGAFGLPDKL
jgi:RNA polymerase sigma-70 factor, ECF subfamily